MSEPASNSEDMMQDRWASETDDEDEFPGFMGIVGRHPSMCRVFEVIRRIGSSSASILINGESGAGKELVAHALHDISSRRRQHLVVVHCGAMPEDLLESELFGHVKGAFTGAIAQRIGRFNLAHGGTIFLDEVGEMSPRFQVKLLRVLEDGAFEPVGSVTTQVVDVRVIAATHRDLHAAVAKGTFREDLLYRLDVVPLRLPPLRERREDIPLIADHFLRLLHTQKKLPRCRLSEDAVVTLMAHNWPGNGRELRNVLERAVLLGQVSDVLYSSDLPPLRAGVPPGPVPLTTFGRLPSESPTPWEFGSEGIDFYSEVEAFEKRMISRALRLAGGSKREAARLLHVNRTTLLEKLKRRGWEMKPASIVPGVGQPAIARFDSTDLERPALCGPTAVFG